MLIEIASRAETVVSQTLNHQFLAVIQKNQSWSLSRPLLTFPLLPVMFVFPFWMQLGPPRMTWIRCLSTFLQMRTYQADFEVLLIGLDGGKKLQQNLLLSTQQLFDKIDAMPMRAQELRKN